MERKLIKQGGGGYTIYLPKKWVNGKGLKEGDNVDVIEKDTSLLIQTHAHLKSEYHLDINQSNRSDLRTLLTHAYRKGFDTINLNGLDEKAQNELKELVHSLLLGFEITSTDKNSAVIENISEPTDQKFDVILKRLFFITQETIKLLIEDSNANKWKRMPEISDILSNHDRFLLFCRRILMKQYIETNPVLIWELLTFLQSIQHNLAYLYKYLEKEKPKLGKETISLLADMENYFSLLSKAYLDKNIESIHLINEGKNKYQFGACIKSLERSKGKETVVLSYVREIYRLIQLGTSPILISYLDQS